MKNFKDKVVVITGGATGIGFGLAKAFGADGATIVIGEPREARLKEAVATLADLGVEAHYQVTDVAQATSVEALADFAWGLKGHVDVLINNAGISIGRSPVTDATMDKVHTLFDVNFFGVWHGCSIFGKRMIDQGTEAAIYNVGSENSFFVAIQDSAAYVASKHAVLGLTESFREETPDFIQVGLICPGFVHSEISPPQVAKLGMPTDQFVDIVMKQIRAGEHFIVSHAYNVERIGAREQEIANAYATYAPRYDGDDEYDARTLAAKFAARRQASG